MPFEELIAPLLNVIDAVYYSEVHPELLSLVKKYKNISSLNDELQIVKKQALIHVMSYLNKSYMKELKHYYTEDGIIYFSNTILNKHIENDMSNLIDEVNK